jgi:hypothetical protein
MNDLFSIRHNKLKITQIALYTLLFVIFVRIIAMQIFVGPDYNVHISIIDKYINGHFYIPHPGFHLLTFWMSKLTNLPYANLLPFMMACFIILSVFVTQKIFQYLCPGVKNNLLYLLMAIFANISIAIYLPFFTQTMYTGQWGPNIFHSPTMTMLKPFALLSFAGIAVYINNSTKKSIELPIISAFLLLTSTYVKPSFAICFIPALAFFLLLKKPNAYKLYLKVFLILLPSLLLLAYQYIETYNLKISESYFHDKIIFTFFGVTKLYTKSVVTSTLVAIAFPLSVAFGILKKLPEKPYLFLSWILFFISFFVSGLLAEQVKFEQGAFIFSYIICLFILFVFSFSEYLSWFAEFKKNKKLIIVCSIFAVAHLISGILYLQKLILLGDYN